MGIAGLYFVFIFILMGFMLPKLLQEIAPHLEPTDTFNGIMIYSVIAILLIRYMMQPLSRLNLENYQVLPIKRDTLVNYLLLKPLLHPLNYIILCIVIPFAFTGIAKVYGAGSTFRFLFLVIFLIWFNTLFASFLKRKFNNLFLGMIVSLVIGGTLAVLEYFKIFSLFQLSQDIFDFLLSRPFIWLAGISLSGLAFLLNKRYFSKNYYPEKINTKVKNRDVDAGRFTFMERFGKTGELISLEMKLILRHSRTKKTLYTAIIFLFYGLIFYPNNIYDNQSGLLMFVAIFVTGIGMIIFGQWIINWDGSHFDFLMTRDIDTRTYIRANYYFMLALSVISFILTTPYFLFGRGIIIYHLVALIYNVGVNIYVYLFGATFNTKRLELSKGSSMNMQGVSYKNFIIMIPLLVIPVMLIVIFNFLSALHIALIILTLLGLSGILFRKPLLKIIEKQFLRRKYALSTGLRKKG